MQEGKGSKFVVDFGDVTLSEEVAAHVNRSIQRAALHAVAGLDFRGDQQVTFHFPKEWLGIIARLDRNSLPRLAPGQR